MNQTITQIRQILVVFLFLATLPLSAQLECTIKIMEDGSTYGVYVRPMAEISPSPLAVTGTGQITVVVPTGFEITDFKCAGGLWLQNARVNAPAENPGKDYVTFGFSYDEPPILYVSGQETLLFSFKNGNEYTEPIALIDNETDPFAQIPNSVGCNPGNELSVFDAPRGKAVYRYYGNYQSETLPFASAQKADKTNN
ncbi:MAG: hypothetical protein D6714_04455 [Bacteroidetes bacterium]|nr:MAG: hypothetical protein D6714_04455 [Bacteroidota bacterium]